MWLRRHVVIGVTEANAIALWNAHTYVSDLGRATPYLHFHSPEPGSGKTTALDLLEATARDAIQADGLSEAALFRLIDKRRPTLLIDEADAIFGKKNSDSTEGIRQVLNSGYRQGKHVWRCVPPSHDVQPFDVFGPKAIAGLHELPGTLAHRSIPIAMKPPLPTDVYEEFDPEEIEAQAEILRRNLQSWADESQDVLRDPRLKPAPLPELDARGNEIWRILLRIADHAGDGWPLRARLAAVELSGRDSRHRDQSAAVRLLSHIRDAFVEERMTCRAIVDALNEDDRLPYGGWNNGAGITTRELGKKLAPYGVLAKTIRTDAARGHGYERTQFADAWSRYLPGNDAQNRDTVTTRIAEPNPAVQNRDTEGFVTVSEKGANAHEQTDVTVVTVLKGGMERERPAGPVVAPVRQTDAERARRFDELYPPKRERA
jgi:hypothetical protein